MIHFTCDMCGKTLLADDDTRYVVKVEVYAAYDPMDIREEDVEEDHSGEVQDLLAEMEGMDAEELEDQVYKTFRFDLCPPCHEAYLKDPLGKGMRMRARFEHN
jgi:hypothetical protein